MEGYANINASHHDFDDLDIEGRVVSEWGQEDEFALDDEDDIQKKHILETKVRVDDGTWADMCSIAKKQHGCSYTCHVCTSKFDSWKDFTIHLGSTWHLTNMRLAEHPKHKFVKLDPKADLSLEPGEPVPPGFEDNIISTCQIQPIIDSYTSSPLIGLEYLVELAGDFDEEPEYTCLLCEKVGKQRSIIGHISGIGHIRKYLDAYFRNAVRFYTSDLPRNTLMKKRLNEVIFRIARKIENNYGRLKPRGERASNFMSRKPDVIREIESGIHFREDPDDRYDDCLLLTDPSPTAYTSVNKPDPNTEAKKEEARTIEDKNPTLERKSTKENESMDKLDGKDDDSKSLFNKGKINAEKRQLRPRDEVKVEKKSSSPEIVGVEIMPSSAKRAKKSPSVSTISSSSSISRTKSRSKSRSLGRSRTRSRVRSPYGRYRGRSPYTSRYRSRSRNRSRDRYSRHSRSNSPGRYRSRRYSRPRGRFNSRSYSRSRSPSPSDKFGRSIKTRVIQQRHYGDKRSRERSYQNTKYSNEADDIRTERLKWEKFRDEFNEMEKELFEKLKHFEKNPEKHPQYPEEWKLFWNKRYKEIQAEGKDPAKHDFKPEWIVFWTKRMKEIHEEDLNKKREVLKNKLGLPTEKEPKPYIKNVHASPPSAEKKDAIADIKQTWKTLTGSDIKESRRPMSPWEEETKTVDESDQKSSFKQNNRNPRKYFYVDTATDVVSLLRRLAVLEDPLGSLGPRVLDLLSVALKMDKEIENGSQKLLENNDHCVFLETAKEKLKGLLFAGIVAKNMVNTARTAIRNIDKLLNNVPPKEPRRNFNSFNQPILQPVIIKPIAKPVDPVSVPGVGKVDKVAIAQQIAAALIQQGRTNVTEDELEQLINAVVGMAEASSNSAQPISTAAYLSQLANNKEESQAKTQSSGLTLLQSAYDDVPKADLVEPSVNVDVDDKNKSPNSNNADELSEADLRNLVQNFNELSDEEKKGLKMYLKKLENKAPELIKQLKPVIPKEMLSKPVIKKSPITIPISKEKSEQKIKPVQEDSGRLSPFSMRSGGVNPTPDSLDLDLSKKLLTNLSKSNSPSSQPILIDNENDDDDDDDDYSFEDVYKAASEKLRLKQLEEEKTKPSEEPDVTIIETSISEGTNLNTPQVNELKPNPDKILPTESQIVKPPEYQVNINNFTPLNYPSNPSTTSGLGLDTFNRIPNNGAPPDLTQHNFHNVQPTSFPRNVGNPNFSGQPGSYQETNDVYLNRNAQSVSNFKNPYLSSQNPYPVSNISNRDLPSNYPRGFDLDSTNFENRNAASNYFQEGLGNTSYNYQPGPPPSQRDFNHFGEPGRYPASRPGNIPSAQSQSFINRENEEEYYRNQNYYDSNNPAYNRFNTMPRY